MLILFIVYSNAQKIYYLRYKTMKKLILALLVVAALIFVIGSVCAWSNGNLSVLQCLIHTVIGACVEWFALKNLEK